MWRDSESEQDFLNFTEVADQIAALATSPALLPVSIGVFGTWGTGKSTVLTLVERTLAGTEPTPIIVKFDAWLYQGYDDSKAALMEVVAEKLLEEAENNEGLTDKVKKFSSRINYFRALSVAADVGVGMALGMPPGLMTRAGTAVASMLSGHASPKTIGAAKEVAVEGAAAAQDLWHDLIRPAEARTPPKEIAKFREEFGEILSDLDRPLILFIDNLDRCLPDVAIGTLEAIRLFLFIKGTAFIIAADEDMVRHSVAKHFGDPNVQHVRDYLDKVIQVPMRVPQVGATDVRAYMYSLFVGLHAPDHLDEVQQHLLKVLQDSWKGSNFTKEEINALAKGPESLLEALAVSDRLAPILATAPTIGGNPRIVKRLLNSITLRQNLAKERGMNVGLATLAKLAVFERSTDGAAANKLYQLVMDTTDATAHLMPNHQLGEKKRPELPQEWKNYEAFLERWREMEPYFEDASALRPALFLSRDVLAPARNRGGLSEAARHALEALIRVTSVNSPGAKEIINSLSPPDQDLIMDNLIGHMREQDISKRFSGLHGAIVLAENSAKLSASLRSFISSFEAQNMTAAYRALLKQKGYL